jgi:hypothetical protein
MKSGVYAVSLLIDGQEGAAGEVRVLNGSLFGNTTRYAVVGYVLASGDRLRGQLECRPLEASPVVEMTSIDVGGWARDDGFALFGELDSTPLQLRGTWRRDFSLSELETDLGRLKVSLRNGTKTLDRS